MALPLRPSMLPFLVTVSACASPAATAPATTAHEHGEGHDPRGPLVHRFDNAETWAKQFDDPARDVWQKPADVVAAMEIAPGMLVADVGAGTGYFEPYLSRAVGAGGKVLAVDVEDDMIRYLRERGAKERWENVTASKVGFDDPGLPTGKVDRVLIVDTWHHIAGREAYAAKLFAGLANGGRVFVVDFTKDATHGPPKAHRIAPEQVVRELTVGGLAAEVLAAKLPEQYIVVGRRPAG
jgi:ubiquinone/menaquinone biosynthesis C-methylase UbiE